MKNKKLFNLITTGFIAFSLTTQTVSAAVPFALEFVDAEADPLQEEFVALADLTEVNNEYITDAFLSNTYLGYSASEQTVVMSGELPENLSYQLVEGDTIHELAGTFQIAISELNEQTVVSLKLLDGSEELMQIELPLNELLLQVNPELAEADKVSETEDEDETETESSEVPSLADETVEEAVAEIEAEEIPEFTYAIDYSNEESASMPRFQEVEELLHGAADSQPSLLMQRFMTTSSSRTHSGGVYTVRSGDTFNAIASSFGLSSTQLRHWNTHVTNTSNLTVGTRLAVTRQGVESMLSQADKDRLFTGRGVAEFSTPQEFIDFIAPMAIEIANQDGVEALYPSLMIAQAAHESNYGRSSLGAPPYHNLSGIKGNHNGQSVLMWTWEVFDGVRVDILAGFRNYPSYTASLQDYANLLRNGLSWDRRYYSGTWRSNTKDVWDVLESRGLRGYATDPRYYEAMVRIINQYDLTQFDSGNFYVRSGTFFGQEAVEKNMASMRSINSNLSYRYEQASNAPFRNRRVETTNEFVGEAAAQRAADRVKNDRGWHATYRQTTNSTPHVRVMSGFFNTRERAERAVEEFRRETGLFATIENGQDNRYRLRTGFFVGEERAQAALDGMSNLDWFGRFVETGDSTSHFVVYTGVFPNPSAVTQAHNYFQSLGWESRETMVNRNTYFYRVFVNGFLSERQANDYVSEVNRRFGWHSAAFPLK